MGKQQVSSKRKIRGGVVCRHDDVSQGRGHTHRSTGGLTGEITAVAVFTGRFILGCRSSLMIMVVGRSRDVMGMAIGGCGCFGRLRTTQMLRRGKRRRQDHQQGEEQSHSHGQSLAHRGYPRVNSKRRSLTETLRDVLPR